MRALKLFSAIVPVFFSSLCCAQNSDIVLADRTGEVYRWSNNRWEELAVNAPLVEGAIVKTGVGSSALISFRKKAAVNLAENTVIRVYRLRFERNEIKEARVQLSAGKIWSVVESLPAAAGKVEIETPNTLAGVRGTIFSAGYEPGTKTTRVGVMAGEVVVASKKTADYVILKENMATVVVANDPPVSPRALEERERRELEQWKNSIPFSNLAIVSGIAEINAMQTQEASRIVRELGIAKKGSEKVLEDFKAIEAAIGLYRADTGQVPSKLADLMASPGIQGWNGPYLGAGTNFIDPYGRPYQYRRKKTPGGRDYLELSTFGLIGAAGETYGEETRLIFLDRQNRPAQ